MTAENVSGQPSEPESLASARQRRAGNYDPSMHTPSEVIGHFLVDAEHYHDSTAIAHYIYRHLRSDGTPTVTGEQAMRDRLKGLMRDPQYRDDTWEDEDEIAVYIYNYLRRTLDRAKSVEDIRLAFRDLLQLRGVDIQDNGGEENFERWNRLVRKLGSAAVQ